MKNVIIIDSIVNIRIISKYIMKKFLYNYIIIVLAINAVALSFDGITLPKDLIYWFITMTAFAVAVMMHKPLLKFLTVKINFLTYLLSASVILFGVMVGLSFIMPEYYISSTTIEGLTFGVLTIEPFVMSTYVSVAFASLISVLIVVIIDSLNKGSE